LDKVVIRLPDDAWHGHSTETVWAERLGGDRHRIRNVPFYATGLSAEDIVATRELDGVLQVERVIIHGGHSTYRVFMAAEVTTDSAAFNKHWKPLEDLGCTYERATERLFGIDVPPTADIHAVYGLLHEAAEAHFWDFEEGHCGHTP
jgi:hypothetical protein